MVRAGLSDIMLPKPLGLHEEDDPPCTYDEALMSFFPQQPMSKSLDEGQDILTNL